jgi:hypothetical protein
MKQIILKKDKKQNKEKKAKTIKLKMRKLNLKNSQVKIKINGELTLNNGLI